MGMQLNLIQASAMSNHLFAIIGTFLFLISASLQGQGFSSFGKPSAKTESEVFSTSNTIAPGETFDVVLKLTHPEKWHSYFKNPGLGIPSISPSVKWELPEGFTAGEIQWPIPHQSAFVGLKSQGYEGTNYFVTTITAPASLTSGETIEIKADAAWQMCFESCLNENASATLTLAVANTAQPNEARTKELADYAKKHIAVDTPDSWKISASDDGDTIKLTIHNAGELPNGLFLYDYDGQLDAQVAQTSKVLEDGAWELSIPRNKGTSLSETHGPVLETLSGILSAKTEISGTGRYGVNISASLAGASATNAVADNSSTEETHSPSHQDTPEEIAAMSKLYDPESKINFVPLKDIPKATIYSALFGAFVGGMLLNLMPCVFPVLGLKVMGFVEQAGNEPKKVRNHGLAFTLGVLISMWVLAGILLVFKLSLGKSVNWGAQMGNPYFVAGIVVLLFVLGLNMAGVFEMGTKLTGAGSGLQQKKGYSGSFFSGVLTTLIATPCSGPFLGAAMAYTLSQSAPVAMFLFSIFALGISFPYLFLSFFPALINKLPRPGAWMETFKVLMSFALFGTAAFFLQSFGSQTGISGMSWMIMGLVALALAAYCFGHWNLPHLKKSSRLWLGKALPLGIAGLGFWMVIDAAGHEGQRQVASTGGHDWKQWRPGKVEHSRSKGRIVWVDYTADW